ncbi:putative Anthranilate synthase [Rhodotorula taiwanensis]|uniref:Multifunctional tryptophan biosynthesis protein n=1 Tax=Rhodotorula taiwanensis TaxID=741276 RepID=A0A2S5B3X5_9BASI|nr:putative Anthranilate synthase [Rhodotorula taiwanensis]
MAATTAATVNLQAVAGHDAASFPKIDKDNHVVMLDNYDSFTWNLYQYLCLLGANMTVIRSEALSLEELQAQHPDMTHLIISPGPGHPLKDSGISVPAIQHYAGKIPILGVCMGLQCITVNYGGVVDQAGEYVHGKTSPILHDGRGLFKGLAQGVAGTRYHSLAARINSIPDCLEVTSRTEGGIIMGLRHRELTVESVQYHPESILSDEGKLMLANFLSWKGGKWADMPDVLTPAASHVANAKSTLAPAAAAATSKSAPSAVPTILNKIEKQRILDVAKAKETPGYRPADLASLIALQVPPPLISFHERLRPSLTSTSTAPSLPTAQHVALLAEVKRASPSKGDIVDASSPSAPAIALSYALAGASVISVLTEPKWFKGSLDDMRAVRAVVDSLPNRPAVLRKDFILDPYQIDEARVYGADTVLLIVAMLDDDKLALLYDHAVQRGMEPLVEVNNAEELERALKVGAKVIGVNNRNLHDFNVDMDTTSRIADVIKDKYPERAGEIILIALSGITGREDVVRYQEQGVSAVLVGESLMRANDKGAFVRKLLGLESPHEAAATRSTTTSSAASLVNGAAAAVQSAASAVVNAVTGSSATPSRGPLVKICGLRTPEAAVAATDAGADMLGLIFVPKSKRNVPLPQAKSIIEAVRARHAHKSPDAVASAAALDPTDWFSFQASRIAAHPRKPLFVGVFQNASLANILHAVDSLGLDLVQLHGSEPTHWARLIPVPVIRAFHVDEKVEADLKEAEQLREATRPGYHALALLDTKVSHETGALSGGAGKAFDWSVARRLVGSRQTIGGSSEPLPIVLAGGLDASNVRKGIEMVRPFAVDISGGVETNGEKDLDKIREFIRLAKQA